MPESGREKRARSIIGDVANYPRNLVQIGSPAGREYIVMMMLQFADHEVAAERERCAKVAEEMPGRILYFYDRAGSPPGNGYRPTTRADIAAAIRSGDVGEG